MIRIENCVANDKVYGIYLTKDSQQKAKDMGIGRGAFLGAAARLANRVNKKYNTYYYAEQNILFDIEFEDQNKMYFLDIKRLNVFEGKRISNLKDPINEIKSPGFFKSYDDGRKVYLNGELPLKIKKMNIPPHFISFQNIFVPEGQYSVYENGIIVDFYCTVEGKYYITNIIKPDFINFGLAVLKN